MPQGIGTLLNQVSSSLMKAGYILQNEREVKLGGKWGCGVADMELRILINSSFITIVCDLVREVKLLYVCKVALDY